MIQQLEINEYESYKIIETNEGFKLVDEYNEYPVVSTEKKLNGYNKLIVDIGNQQLWMIQKDKELISVCFVGSSCKENIKY